MPKAACARQVWDNCRKYNPVGTPVRAWGDELSALFERKWAEARVEDQWLALQAARLKQVSSSCGPKLESSQVTVWFPWSMEDVQVWQDSLTLQAAPTGYPSDHAASL